MEESPGFALFIVPKIQADGATTGYVLQSRNNAVPKEIILTVVRHWLRESEDEYHKTFLQAGY